MKNFNCKKTTQESNTCVYKNVKNRNHPVSDIQPFRISSGRDLQGNIIVIHSTCTCPSEVNQQAHLVISPSRGDTVYYYCNCFRYYYAHFRYRAIIVVGNSPRTTTTCTTVPAENKIIVIETMINAHKRRHINCQENRHLYKRRV